MPCLTWLVSSIAATARPRRGPRRRAASSSPATANRRTTPIAAKASHLARLSSRCVRCGVRSPARCAIVHPLRSGHVTGQGSDVLARLQPRLHPHEARPQQAPAAHPASAGPARPLSWRQQPPSVLLSSHTHDREAAALSRTGSFTTLRRRSTSQMGRVGDWRGFRRLRLRFQSPPVKPCMRFSRTRLTDVLHRVHSAFSPPGPEGPGRDDGSVEGDQAQVVWGQQHLFDAPSPGVAPVAFLGQP